LRHIHNGVILHAHPVRGESHNQRNTTGEVATTSPPFYNEPHRSHVLCVKAEFPHNLHVLATAPFCCDRKSRAACAQSFAPWQQATIEITRRDHSIIACLHHIHNGVILHAHPVRGESQNQRNTTGEVATIVNDGIHYHHIILDRENRTKSLGLSPDAPHQKVYA